MTTHVQLFDDGLAFLAQAEPFLLQDEAANSLMLGAVAAATRQTLNRRRFRPVFAMVNEHDLPVAALAWTLPHKPLLSADPTVSDEALRQLLTQVTPGRTYPDAVFGPVAATSRLAQFWADAQGLTVRNGMEQRLFALREVVWPNPMASGSMHPATYWNREMLGQWIAAFQAEAVPDEATDLEAALLIADRVLADENVFIWLAEPHGAMLQPVALAARARPTHNSIAVNLVYTPPEFRRNGYASALVASLSHHLLEQGWKYCTLFTDITNPISNHIYKSIGYRPVMNFTEYRLVTPKHSHVSE